MNVYVISMLSATERRKSCARQLSGASVEFRFFDAQVVTNGYKDFFAEYDEREFQINTGRVVAKGEIGCYASHLALWKTCVDRNEPILIMEDDFLLDSKFPEALKIVEEEVSKYGFIRMQSERRGRQRLVKKSGTFQLGYYTRMPHSTMCYAINPVVAAEFIHQAEVLDAPVDVMIKKIWEHKQRLYGLSPYTVLDSEYSADTMITGRVKHQKPLNIKIFRFIRKAKWLIKRLAFTAFFKPPI